MPNASSAPAAPRSWSHDLRQGNSSRNAIFAILGAIIMAVAEFSSSQMREANALAIGLASGLCITCITTITGLRVRAPHWRYRFGSLLAALGGITILLVGCFLLAKQYIVATRIQDVHLLSITRITPLATCLLFAGGILQLPRRAMFLSFVPLASALGLAAVIVRQPHLASPGLWVGMLASMTAASAFFACWRLRHCGSSPAIKVCHGLAALALGLLSVALIVLGLLPNTSWQFLHTSGILTWGAVAATLLVFISCLLPYPHPPSKRQASRNLRPSTPCDGELADAGHSGGHSAETTAKDTSAAPARSNAARTQLADGTALYEAGRRKAQEIPAAPETTVRRQAS